MKYIADVSMGKDSVAMLLVLIYGNYPLDEIVFYDTGMEFEEKIGVPMKPPYTLKERFIKDDTQN